MRTILLFCVFLIVLFTNTKAQNNLIIDSLPWAPQGATWIYQAGPGPPITIRVSGDTIIANKQTKKFKFYNMTEIWSDTGGLVIGSHINYSGEEYLYNSNDSVYMYDIGLQKFVFLYYSYPQVGDTWLLKTTYTDCYTTHYDSVQSHVIIEDTLVYVNHIAYKAYNTKSNGLLSYEHIIPNIGSYKSFHPQIKEDSCSFVFTRHNQGDYGGLICYTDNIRGKLIIKKSTYSSIDWSLNNSCDILNRDLDNFTVGIERPSLADNKNDKFSIYPNPAHSALNIYSNGIAMEEIMIYDAVGRLVIHDKSRNQSIDINSLMSGLYIINIVDEYKQVSAFKFVKD